MGIRLDPLKSVPPSANHADVPAVSMTLPDSLYVVVLTELIVRTDRFPNRHQIVRITQLIVGRQLLLSCCPQPADSWLV